MYRRFPDVTLNLLHCWLCVKLNNLRYDINLFNMIDSDQLHAFLLVFDTGSLSHAATRAHITQPALGRKVHLLEEALGVQLFERTRRGMSPTLEGLKLESRARPLIEQMQQLKHFVAKDEVSGPVTLAVTPSIGMTWASDMIEQFITRYPSAQLRAAAVLSGAMGEGVGRGRYDIGLLYSPHTTPHLVTSELWQERTFFVSGARTTRRASGPQQPIAGPHQRSITLSEVLRRPLILPSSESGIFALLEMEARKLNLRLTPALIIDSIQLALEMVRGGRYGFILTERALRDLRAKKLHAIPIVRPTLKRAAQVASTEIALSRPVVRALWDHIHAQRVTRPYV